MVANLKSPRSVSLNIGMIVEEISSSGKNRLGEIVAIFGEKRKKLQILELNRHDLSPFFSSGKERLKFLKLRHAFFTRP